MSVSFSLSGLPAPKDAIFATMTFEGTKFVVFTHVRSDEAYRYEGFDRLADARAALERIIEQEPDQWVEIIKDVHVRKPAMRSAQAENDDYTYPAHLTHLITFTWGPDDNTVSSCLVFGSESERDRALRAYNAVSFIPEAHAHGNISTRKRGEL
ncbi:MAG TPA: hypothetical protein VLB83_04285 [Candidatus Paceibacterota bacterium]|nr:hypothetical protein [Candidatus Paceibacterota bacterium]